MAAVYQQQLDTGQVNTTFPYPNISHKHGLVLMQKALNAWEDNTVSTDSLTELAECVLKSIIFKDKTSFYKQIRGTATETKMGLSDAKMFIGDLKDKLFKDCDMKPLTWWWYINCIFML